jgi:hypothetical protein
MIVKLMKEIKGMSSKSPALKKKALMVRNQTVNIDEMLTQD